jgi:hypothetical protein
MNKTMKMIRSAEELKLTTVSKPDISTLLRIGHFYFALTNFFFRVDKTGSEV